MIKLMSLNSLLIIYIIAFATSPNIFLGTDARNYFLITIMIISPLIILFSKKFYLHDIWLFSFMFTMVLFPSLNHPESMRWSTVFYTIMFGLTFIAYKQLLYRNLLCKENYFKLIKYLIFSYFIVLLIQQVCVLFGLPVLLAGNYNPHEPWKLSSISAEPSHTSLNVIILMYSYLTVKELFLDRKYKLNLDIKNDKWVWLAFLWILLTSHSASAILLLLLFSLKFINFRNFLVVALFLAVFTISLSNLESGVFQRASKIISGLSTFDIKTIISADHSGSYRFIPAILIAERVDITTIDGLFGHGVDYVSSFLYLVMPGTPKGYSTGGIMIVWIEYGFISFMLFMIFSLSSTYRKHAYMDLLLLFIFLFLGNGINTQIVWLGIILLMTNKYFYGIQNNIKYASNKEMIYKNHLIITEKQQ